MFFSYITACEEVCKGCKILLTNWLLYIGSIGSLNVVGNISEIFLLKLPASILHAITATLHHIIFRELEEFSEYLFYKTCDLVTQNVYIIWDALEQKNSNSKYFTQKGFIYRDELLTEKRRS